MINDWDMARPSTEVLCRGRSETIGPCMEVPCKRLRRNEFASTWGPVLGVMIYDSDMVSLSVGSYVGIGQKWSVLIWRSRVKG